MLLKLKRFLVDDRGLESLEYAIMVGLVVAGSLIALAAIGVWIASVYTNAQTLMGA